MQAVTVRQITSNAILILGYPTRIISESYTDEQIYADVMVNINKTFADNKFSLVANVGASVNDTKSKELSYLAAGDFGTNCPKALSCDKTL